MTEDSKTPGARAVRACHNYELKLSRQLVEMCRENEHISTDILDLLGSDVPRRWGRMDLSSRIAIASVAMLKKGAALPEPLENCGFIVGSRFGSLATDLSYAAGLLAGQPSPILFSYTLPNIAPSEAASFFGMRGPVYAVLDSILPLQAARGEAERLFDHIPGLDYMLYAAIDVLSGGDVSATVGAIGIAEEGEPAAS